MTRELIERVKRAEEKADALLAAANEKAAKLVEQAEIEAKTLFEKRAKAIFASREKTLADAEKAGKKQAEEFLKNSAGERKKLEASWRRNAPRAAA
ncbi:MAG: hypothetical protein QW343_00410, partial [Candidatus Norongarragalinales archaeon]